MEARGEKAIGNFGDSIAYGLERIATDRTGKGPRTVVDVSAHHGWFFHCWLDWCPEASVQEFEPFPELFSRMSDLYGDDPRTRLVRSEVVAEVGEMKLNVLTEAKVANSFLAPNTRT